ncbi:MAG: hypothetical protein O6945_17320 [Gammaproteobacteria bacterium]|nr:hypothetical protein [Gammaproteobacteria bacterium]
MAEKSVIDQAINREDLYGTNSEATYGGALGFMRRKYTKELTRVDVVVTGIPYDTATTNQPGARFGQASRSFIRQERENHG